MKTGFFACCSLLALSCLAGACRKNNAADTDYTAFVNTFVGTGGHGHTFPGPVVPHGMIQPGPDTRIDGWDACSGYYDADTLINGFAHTRLSGTGCADFGDVLLMPTVGAQVCNPQDFSAQNLPYASAFSHRSETARPGYYSVFLKRYGVKAELTATERAALHRYTFPASDSAGFILDLDYSIQHQTNLDLRVEVPENTVIRGFKKTRYWAFDQQVGFYARFSKPFTYSILRDTLTDRNGTPQPRCKVLLRFHTKPGEQVMVKVGISAVDWQGAQRNLEKEIPGWDFEAVSRQAQRKWNDYLSKIQIETPDTVSRNIFYTALYHTAISPVLHSDVDGRYLGMDLQIHRTDTLRPVYTIFSLWDTFRALHPLLSIIDPQHNNDYIRSLLLKSREGGIFPMWDVAGNYTGTMIGYHAASLIADACTKGYADFDLREAYRACLRAAEYDTAGIKCPALVLPHLMPKAKLYKNTLGYIPCDLENEAVAKALEYAYDDWCISVLADSLGDTRNARKYQEQARAYSRYFDPATGFMRGLDSKGHWRTPFNPKASNHRNDDYCEGNAWQWTWFVPHDVEGLARLMGGEDACAARLDSLFTTGSELEGSEVSADISGLIGQYAHGNEPSHHIIHLYNYLNRPWKTQQLIDRVLREQYRLAPDGLSGNEDCGQMSAWYVLNAIGIYQVCPGKPIFSIGRPLFPCVTIPLPGGKAFRVITHHNSTRNCYIRSATLNGKPLHTPFITYADIMAGGTLECYMDDKPSDWGRQQAGSRNAHPEAPAPHAVER